MKKPEPRLVKRLYYHECEEYIGHKLGYELRDTLGSCGKKNVEYRDFWHFILDRRDIHNGCEFRMPSPTEAKKDWQKVILEEFHKEFGEGPYWVEW